MADDKKQKSTADLDYQMLIIKNFIDEFYNKTVFKSGRSKDADISPSFIKSIFAFADENTAYPIGALGENAKVKRSTMTDMVDRMERDGLAERVRDDDDRRVVKVRLTQKGKRVRKEFHRKRRAEFQTVFSQLSAEEIRDFVAHLEAAYNILKKIN